MQGQQSNCCPCKSAWANSAITTDKLIRWVCSQAITKNQDLPIKSVYNAENYDITHGIFLRLFIFIACLITSSLGLANKPATRYQVDLIVFSHRNTQVATEHPLTLLSSPTLSNAIPLQRHQGSKTPLGFYQRLPASASQLAREYWGLTHQPNYHVLFHYTWLQPNKNEKRIALSEVTAEDWHIEGTVCVKQSNYYLLNTELMFSKPNSPQSAFRFSQQQRLKPEVVYYLDHPQAGMLIKIHAMS